MQWFSVDGGRRYLAGLDPCEQSPLPSGFKPTRKTVYAMVENGMRVARIGNVGTDSRGRRREGRIFLCAEWIDGYLIEQATIAGKPAARKSQTNATSATNGATPTALLAGAMRGRLQDARGGANCNGHLTENRS